MPTRRAGTFWPIAASLVGYIAPSTILARGQNRLRLDGKVLYPKTSHPLLVGLGVRVFSCVAENAKSRPMAAVYEMVAGAGFEPATFRL